MIGQFRVSKEARGYRIDFYSDQHKAVIQTKTGVIDNPVQSLLGLSTYSVSQDQFDSLTVSDNTGEA